MEEVVSILKKTFITTVLTAVKKNKQPTVLANSFVIGTAVINTHQHTLPEAQAG